MKAIIIATLLAVSFVGYATERPMSQNEKIVSEFITTATECERGNTQSCEQNLKICTLVVANDKELEYFIRHDYPYKAKNGGMNIQARYSKAKRNCSK